MSKEESTGLNEMDLVSLLALVQTGKVSEAISIVEANPNPTEAATAFIELARKTYRDLKDVSSMVAIGNAGTEFALLKAASSGNASDSEKLKRSAKVLAFNTAANCWPGWGDPGIEIAKQHLEAGLKLAMLCRDLTVELNLSHKERGGAHWLIGALHLAMSQYAESHATLQRAKEEFQVGGNSEHVLMAEGYAALVLKAQRQSRQEGARELDRILSLLSSQNSKEAKFFADQLVTADRILVGVSPSQNG